MTQTSCSERSLAWLTTTTTTAVPATRAAPRLDASAVTRCSLCGGAPARPSPRSRRVPARSPAARRFAARRSGAGLRLLLPLPGSPQERAYGSGANKPQRLLDEEARKKDEAQRRPSEASDSWTYEWRRASEDASWPTCPSGLVEENVPLRALPKQHAIETFQEVDLWERAPILPPAGRSVLEMLEEQGRLIPRSSAAGAEREARGSGGARKGRRAMQKRVGGGGGAGGAGGGAEDAMGSGAAGGAGDVDSSDALVGDAASALRGTVADDGDEEDEGEPRSDGDGDEGGDEDGDEDEDRKQSVTAGPSELPDEFDLDDHDDRDVDDNLEAGSAVVLDSLLGSNGRQSPMMSDDVEFE